MSGSLYIDPIMSPPNRNHLVPFAAFLGGYIAFNLAAITGAFEGARPPGTWGLALAVSAPAIGLIWAHLAWLRASDEFVRAIHAKRFIVATGISMAAASAWGFMEIHGNVRHLSPALFVPVFYTAYLLVSPFIRNSH